MLFSALTMNTQALHLDAAYSATQPFGQRLMNSMWTLATMVGASVTQLTQGTLVAQLGLSDIAFPHPLFAGDTLYTETTIESKRLSSSRPGQGLVTMRHTGRNQDGTVVATATRVALMWCADARCRCLRVRVPMARSPSLSRGRRDRVHPGPRSAVLPGRPARALREGARTSGCRHPRSGGCGLGDVQGGGTRRGDRVRPRSRPRDRADQPARYRGVRVGPVDPLADRLPHRDGGEGRGREGAEGDRPALLAHRPVRDGTRSRGRGEAGGEPSGDAR